MIRRHGRDDPQPDLVLRHVGVFPPGRRLLFEKGRGRGGPSREAGRAPERQRLAWPGRCCPGIASRQAGRSARLRGASSGPCDRDEAQARAPARRAARAPSGLRHHLLRPEVGVAGGASADEGEPARRPRGHQRTPKRSHTLSLTAARLRPAPPRGRRRSGGPRSRPVARPSRTDALYVVLAL